MRWFKHLTDAADDEKLADVLTEFGPEGFGVWWLLCEVVGKQMDSTERCDASYSLEHWARKLYVSKRKTTSFLTVFSEKNLISLEYDSSNAVGKIIVKIPNMLKFRDEYSKKSGQTPDRCPDKLQTKIQIQKQKQKQTEKQSNKGVRAFAPPSPDEVGEYMLEIGYHGNAQKFCDHYHSNGWMVGKNKMKDWKAAVRTWRGNDNGRQGTFGSAASTGAKAGKPQSGLSPKTGGPGYFAGDFPNRSDEW